MDGFTHLHVASGYSARYGASLPPDLVRRSAERGMGTLATTDRDAVTGVVRFAKAAGEHGVRPVFGVDLAVEPLMPQPPGRGAGPPPGAYESGQDGQVVEPPLRVTLLARDGPGWAALCRLTSAAHALPVRGGPEHLPPASGRIAQPGEGPMEWAFTRDDRAGGPASGAYEGASRAGRARRLGVAYDDPYGNAYGSAYGMPYGGVRRPRRLWPVVSWDALRRYGGSGLIVLLGPLSEPVRALAAGWPDLAGRLLGPWREVFGPSLRLEVVWHEHSGSGSRGECEGEGPGGLALAAGTLAFADEVGAPAVLTNAVRYADPEQHRIADVLDSARLLRPVDRRRVDGGQRWLKDAGAMGVIAGRIAEAAGLDRRRAERLMAETVETGEECRMDPVADLGLGRRHLPEPRAVGAVDAEDACRVLRERCEAGLVGRGLDRDPAARARLDGELARVAEMGLAPYFLTVAQVVSDIRKMGIRVAARGSGAGSMVNHVLSVATANPLDHGLLFERFLSSLRTDLPDIDLDVESARRLEVYDRVLERFGRERVALTGMPETFRARQAIRAAGLALDLPPAEVDRIAKSFPHIRASDITAALAELPELRQLAAEAPAHQLLFELAEGLDALPRGLAMHPCGVILTDASLLDRLPVQPTPTGGFPMVQADKEDVEDLGMIKLDILGVRMQSAMAHAAAEIERVTGRRVDLDDPRRTPPADPLAFRLIRASDTLGVFQLESPGQMDLLSRMRPRDPQDVVADISLFRPGPVAGGMPERYVAARHGAACPSPHPDLDPVLRDTCGVVIWHEQIMEILSVLTGCDLDFADCARRALSDRARLGQLRDWFHRRAAERGYASEVRDEVWRTVEAFGAYGFARAHAVAFAVPALQSAWLKAHHPAALYAGLLEHDPGMWPKRVIVADARRHGVPVLSVDVHRSGRTHAVERTPDGVWGVRLALTEVRGISEGEVARIVAGRPYSSLSDFWERARPKRPTAERLAAVGALAPLSGPLTRRDLLLRIGELHRGGHGRHGGRAPGDGQIPLRMPEEGEGVHGFPGRFSQRAAGLPEMSGREIIKAELGVLGIDVSMHLMDCHRRLLRELGVVDAERLGRMRAGRTVLVAGVRASTQTPPIASGKRIIFVTLDDASGLVDLAFFEDSHADCAHTIFHRGLLLVRGVVRRRGGRATVVGTAVWDLEALAAARSAGGPEAVRRLLDPAAGAGDGAEAGAEVGVETEAGTRTGGGRAARRAIAQETGALLHPWADLRPAGERAADPATLDPDLPYPDLPYPGLPRSEPLDPEPLDAEPLDLELDLTSLGHTSPGSAG